MLFKCLHRPNGQKVWKLKFTLKIRKKKYTEQMHYAYLKFKSPSNKFEVCLIRLPCLQFQLQFQSNVKWIFWATFTTMNYGPNVFAHICTTSWPAWPINIFKVKRGFHCFCHSQNCFWSFCQTWNKCSLLLSLYWMWKEINSDEKVLLRFRFHHIIVNLIDLQLSFFNPFRWWSSTWDSDSCMV